MIRCPSSAGRRFEVDASEDRGRRVEVGGFVDSAESLVVYYKIVQANFIKTELASSKTG